MSAAAVHCPVIPGVPERGSLCSHRRPGHARNADEVTCTTCRSWPARVAATFRPVTLRSHAFTASDFEVHAAPRPPCLATNVATDGPVPATVACVLEAGHVGKHLDYAGFGWQDGDPNSTPHHEEIAP